MFVHKSTIGLRDFQLYMGGANHFIFFKYVYTKKKICNRMLIAQTFRVLDSSHVRGNKYLHTHTHTHRNNNATHKVIERCNISLNSHHFLTQLFFIKSNKYMWGQIPFFFVVRLPLLSGGGLLLYTQTHAYIITQHTNTPRSKIESVFYV